MPQSDTTCLDIVLGIKARGLQYKSIEAVIITVEQLIGTRTYSRCEVIISSPITANNSKDANSECLSFNISFGFFLGHYPTGTGTTMLKCHSTILLRVFGPRLSL